MNVRSDNFGMRRDQATTVDKNAIHEHLRENRSQGDDVEKRTKTLDLYPLIIFLEDS